jgi:hypothetical protein
MVSISPLDFNNRGLDEHSRSLENRPIWGTRWGAVTLAVNPSLRSGLDRGREVAFSPAAKVEYAASRGWTFALEHHAELGPLRQLHSLQNSSQRLFATTQHRIGVMSIEAGAGWGLTHASDHLTLEMTLEFELR